MRAPLMALAPHFAWMVTPAARAALCRLFAAGVRCHPSLAPVAPVLVGLNALQAGRVDLEPDFDARFKVRPCHCPGVMTLPPSVYTS